MTNKRKKKGWFKVCPEKWIFGSTREEMTSAERGVWIDFLALAYLNEPPGQIDFFTYKRIANQLNISVKLLKSTVSKALFHGKIDLIEKQIKSELQEKEEELNLNCSQLDAKSDTLESNQVQSGLPLRSIIILNWNEYQSEYLRQKPYRQKKSTENEKNEDRDKQHKKLQNSDLEVVTQVTDRGEERRREKKRKEERRTEKKRGEKKQSKARNGKPGCGELSSPDKNTHNSPLPSKSKSLSSDGMTVKEQFLSMLRECHGYPFDEMKDSLLFDCVVVEYPGINILKQLDRKIAWWKNHPDALKANPREQLLEWFKKEYEFRKREGPQQIGEIMNEIKDADHRKFIKSYLELKS